MSKKTESAIELAGVRLTSPERVYYPDAGITKVDLARYYEAVVEWVLPELRDRPLTLLRCPSGVGGECFVQRKAGGGLPDTLTTVYIDRESTYVVARSLADVLRLVQAGVLEIHTWGSRRDRLDRPDRVIFDLDPAPDVGWAAVVWAAKLVRERLGEFGLESWVKTTGGKGVHVVAPLTRRHDWDAVHRFSRAVAEALEREHPERLLARASKAERGGRVFVDYLRNSWSASAVAAYSTRARPGAPVATPVGWDELERIGGGAAFTVATLPARLRGGRADPWAGYRTARQSLTKAALRAVGVV